jgi:Universal stress protein family
LHAPIFDTSRVALRIRRTAAFLVDNEGVCPVETEALWGVPTDALLEQVTQHAIDHIVPGRTDKGAIQRLPIGSASRDLIAARRPASPSLRNPPAAARNRSEGSLGGPMARWATRLARKAGARSGARPLPRSSFDRVFRDRHETFARSFSY